MNEPSKILPEHAEVLAQSIKKIEKPVIPVKHTKALAKYLSKRGQIAGKVGGLSRSAAKVAAGQNNSAKAREALRLKRAADKLEVAP
jgi:hypothetical protein